LRFIKIFTKEEKEEAAGGGGTKLESKISEIVSKFLSFLFSLIKFGSISKNAKIRNP
jgi:hypothetical protein